MNQKHLYLGGILTTAIVTALLQQQLCCNVAVASVAESNKVAAQEELQVAHDIRKKTSEAAVKKVTAPATTLATGAKAGEVTQAAPLVATDGKAGEVVKTTQATTQKTTNTGTENASTSLPDFHLADPSDVDTLKTKHSANFLFDAGTATLRDINPELQENLICLAGQFGEHGNKTLIITGQFAEGEANSTEFSNLGFARAEAIKAQFVDAGMDDAQIITFSKMLPELASADGAVVAAAFAVDTDEDIREGTVQETSGSTASVAPVMTEAQQKAQAAAAAAAIAKTKAEEKAKAAALQKSEMQAKHKAEIERAARAQALQQAQARAARISELAALQNNVDALPKLTIMDTHESSAFGIKDAENFTFDFGTDALLDIDASLQDDVKYLADELNENPHKSLTITGQYLPSDIDASEPMDLGYRRARSIEKQFLDAGVKPNQLALQSEEVEMIPSKDAKSVAARFDIVTDEAMLAEMLAVEKAKADAEAEAQADAEQKAMLEKLKNNVDALPKLTIMDTHESSAFGIKDAENFTFDFGTDALLDIDASLQDDVKYLADELNENPHKSLTITGQYLPSDIDASEPMDLGYRRARSIEKQFLDAGVKPNQLALQSEEVEMIPSKDAKSVAARFDIVTDEAMLAEMLAAEKAKADAEAKAQADAEQKATLEKLRNNVDALPPIDVKDETGKIVVDVSDNFTFDFGTDTLQPLNSTMSDLVETVKKVLDGAPARSLTITGQYLPSDIDASEPMDLGYRRARSIEKQFLDAGVKPNQLALQSEEVEMIPSKDAKSVAARFDLMTDEAMLAEMLAAEKAKADAEAKKATEEADAKIAEAKKLAQQKANDELADSIRKAPLILYFKTNQAQINLTDEQKQTIAKIQQYLKQVPNAKVRVIGHTDSVGKRDMNVRLGLKRAEFAANWLTKAGIARDSIKVESKGPDAPIASNNTRSGRAKNRRVEVTVE